VVLTESAADFIDTDEFAVAAVHNGTTTLSVIPSVAYEEPLDGVESKAPGALASNETAFVQGDTLSFGGDDYVIVNVRKDEAGLFTKLRLRMTT